MINKLKIVHNIGLSILIIGLINIYNIVKEGLIFNLPSNFSLSLSTTPYDGIDNNLGIKEYLTNISIFKIDINSIKIIIFITIVLYVIFNLNNSSTIFPSIDPTYIIPKCNIEQSGIEKRDTLEYKLLIGLGIIGLILMIISKELIILYLGLELYSFTIYVLILVKESIIIRKISIIYLILSSLASGLLLYTFSLIYNKYGSLDIDIIGLITNTLNNNNNIILYLIIIALLFKLGSVPFSFWLIRVYADLDKRILWYQLTVPKLVFFILLIKFLNVFYNFESLTNNYFIYILFLVSLFSLVLGSIGGLFQNRDNLLLSYSSILNIGYILLSLSLLLTSPEFTINIDNASNLWILYHFFIIYIINLLGLFSILILYYKSSLVFNFRTFFSNPFFFISFLILIFSFIGIPPFSGFFSKFFLLFTLFSSSNNYTYISTIAIFAFLLFSFISSFFYLKFLFSSSSSPISFTHFQPLTEVKEASFSSLLLSFVTLLTITYPFLLAYFIPLLQEIYIL